MRFKRLSNTSELIASIGQGTGIGGYLAKTASYGKEHIEALRYGIELGMTFIDTAEEYGNGDAERAVAEATRDIREKVFIATKISSENLAYNKIINSIESSLKRLRTDYIDLYQIHWPNCKIPLTETMQAMEYLIDKGKIRYIGVCNFSLKELKESESSLIKNKIVSIQVEYNLFDRSIEDSILPYCEQANITTIAYSPLARGKVFRRSKKLELLKKIAEKHNKTIAQIVLNWLVRHPSIIVIPKSTNLEHIRENAASIDFELSKEDFDQVGSVFKNEIFHIPIDKISVKAAGKYGVYQTPEEAKENKFGFVPSPVDLAQEIRNGEILKPVRVINSNDKMAGFELVEGRLRYWAWVIAYNGQKPIPAIIEDS